MYVVSEPTREGDPLDLLFENREELVGKVLVGDCHVIMLIMKWLNFLSLEKLEVWSAELLL